METEKIINNSIVCQANGEIVQQCVFRIQNCQIAGLNYAETYPRELTFVLKIGIPHCGIFVYNFEGYGYADFI